MLALRCDAGFQPVEFNGWLLQVPELAPVRAQVAKPRVAAAPHPGISGSLIALRQEPPDLVTQPCGGIGSSENRRRAEDLLRRHGLQFPRLLTEREPIAPLSPGATASRPGAMQPAP